MLGPGWLVPKIKLVNVANDIHAKGSDMFQFIFIADPYIPAREMIERIKAGEYAIKCDYEYSFHHKLVQAHEDDFMIIEEPGFNPILICKTCL